MKPQSSIVKSDHALKKAPLYDHSPMSHVNPLGKKGSLNKRHSLNVSHDNSSSNVNYIKFQPNQQLGSQRIINPQQNNNISIGEKPYISPQTQRKVHELSLKLQRIEIELERHNKKISIIENKKQLENDQSNRIQIMKDLIVKTLEQKEKPFNLQRQEIRFQVESVKSEMNNVAKKKQLDMAFLTLEKDIKETKKTILKNTELIQMEIGEIIKNQEIIKEKEFKSVQKIVEEKIRVLSSQFRKQITKKSPPEVVKSSQKIFIGCPILLKLQSKFMISNMKKDKQLQKSEVVYKIDFDGFLLDEDNRYLLDENSRQIKLSQEQLAMLRDKNVLK